MSKSPYIPIQEDSTIPRCFKVVPILDSDGNIIGNQTATFNLTSFPDPSSLDVPSSIDFSDPVQAQAVYNQNQGVDLVSSPYVDAMSLTETLSNIKENLNE